jgi:putative ABC transport system permease protein
MFNLRSCIENGIREIWTHKVRSLLSMLGVILGVAALVVMVAIVQGIIGNFRVFFEEQGGVERVTINNAQPPEEQRMIASISPGRTYRDAVAIREAVPLVTHVSPEITIGWRRLQSQRRTYNTPVRAVSPDFQFVSRFEVAEGRFIGDVDIERAANVIVLGDEIRHRLFSPMDDPIGQTVTFDETSFTVIGVLRNYTFDQGGRNALWHKNRIALIPITAAIHRFQGNDQISALNVRVASMDHIRDVVPQLENTLLPVRRGILDFSVDTQEEQLQSFLNLERSLMLALGGIAGISLVIGGIGIMNVMLASVHERIREIGVRKAVGARSSDVFLQFLVESCILSVLGGIIGLSLSIVLIDVAGLLLSDISANLALPQEALVLGLVFSVGVGIIAGLYPALRAARLDPIDALRFE